MDLISTPVPGTGPVASALASASASADTSVAASASVPFLSALQPPIASTRPASASGARERRGKFIARGLLE